MLHNVLRLAALLIRTKYVVIHFVLRTLIRHLPHLLQPRQLLLMRRNAAHLALTLKQLLDLLLLIRMAALLNNLGDVNLRVVNLHLLALLFLVQLLALIFDQLMLRPTVVVHGRAAGKF